MKPGFQKIMMISIALIFTIHFFKKCANLGLFFIYFRPFKHTLQFFHNK